MNKCKLRGCVLVQSNKRELGAASGESCVFPEALEDQSSTSVRRTSPCRGLPSASTEAPLYAWCASSSFAPPKAAGRAECCQGLSLHGQTPSLPAHCAAEN